MLIGANIDIKGMMCHGCSAAIKLALEDTQGVNQVQVDLKGCKAKVLYDARHTSPEEICAVINGLGYQATVAVA